MPIAAAQIVQGATRQPFPYGLFSTFTFRSGDRFEGGVQWEPTFCEIANGLGAWDCAEGSTQTGPGWPKDLNTSRPPVTPATPFVIYGHFDCLSTGWPPGDAQDEATAMLLATEEIRTEQAFWTGDLGNTPNLADAAEEIAGGTAVDIVSAIAMLEDYSAGHHGGLGVLHMSRGVATAAVSKNLVLAVGGRLTTVLGSPVAAGAGYPGSAPDGTPSGNGTSWAFVSPAVFGYRSDVFTSSARPGDLLDRGTNMMNAIAERNYLLGFDPCGVGAVNVKLL